MQRLQALLGAALIAGAVAACDLMPFLLKSGEEPGASQGAVSPTPEPEVTLPSVDANPSTQNLPSPTIKIPPPID